METALQELGAGGGGGGQAAIQFKDEGSNIGTSGAVTAVDFTGTGVTATETGGVVTVAIASGGGSGDVVGPSSATDSYPALFDGTTGKLIKQGTGTLGTAAYTAASAYATAAQGTKADSAVQSVASIDCNVHETVTVDNTRTRRIRWFRLRWRWWGNLLARILGNGDDLQYHNIQAPSVTLPCAPANTFRLDTRRDKHSISRTAY